MSQITIVLGNKNYSSWSLRPWLALKHAGADFQEVVIPLQQPSTREAIARYSPSGRLPVLIDGGLKIWDSLAICEHLAERFPDAGLWPQGREARAEARAVTAEMHSGFAALREQFTMNLRRQGPTLAPSQATAADLQRIGEIWRDCRKRFGREGDFLFGRWSIADAFYAPVVTRFLSYGVALGPIESAYVKAVMADPAMVEWMIDAKAETWVIEGYIRPGGAG